MGTHDEMTRFAFISHMEDYLKKLITTPEKADTDEFLKSHGINGPKALEMLTKRTINDDPNSAVVIKSTRIVDNGTDENTGKRLQDSFKIKYKIPRKDYNKKMRNLYISLFENYQCDKFPISECDCGAAMGGDGGATDGATNASASGQYSTPLFGKPIKRQLYITQEQSEYLKAKLEEEAVMDTPIGDFGYDVPMGKKGDKFYDEANDHKDMIKKGCPKK